MNAGLLRELQYSADFILFLSLERCPLSRSIHESSPNSALLAQPSRGDIFSFIAGADRAAEEAAGGQAEVPLTPERVPPGVSVLARTRDANPAVGGGWRRLTAVQPPGAVLRGRAVLLARLRALLVAAGRVEVDAGGLADVGGVVGHECCLADKPLSVTAEGFRV